MCIKCNNSGITQIVQVKEMLFVTVYNKKTVILHHDGREYISLVEIYMYAAFAI